jgi:hypothetical protein
MVIGISPAPDAGKDRMIRYLPHAEEALSKRALSLNGVKMRSTARIG